MKFLSCFVFAVSLFVVFPSHGQAPVFTHADTLRGSITPERAWWDLTYYHLDVHVFPDTKTISGDVAIHYRVLTPSQVIQVDLQPPLSIETVTQDGKPLAFEKDGPNAYMITLQKPQQKDQQESIVVHYAGAPRVAKNPPWDGGFQWEKDLDGNDFIATSCQELGSSAWWPCKDHMYDEPDSMLISVTVPSGLQDVSNGRLRKVTENNDGTTQFDWYVDNPINNYGVNVNIGNYTHFSDTLHGEKGVLDLNFYVLPYDLEKAKEQFTQAKKMLKAFEYWMGPYPFYEDGYKLVEVPYLGMEHQSSVTYGNGFKNGYRGRDLSGSGWGMKWDFIIIHESGHEWFANNITYKDIADMWIHESFTNYSESLYIEYYYGKDAANEYVVGTRQGIGNKSSIMGIHNVNHRGSGDMYPKGGNMIQTIRHSIHDDVLFRQILRGLNETFYHQTVTSQQIEDYISEKAGFDYSRVFYQYLNTIQIPTLQYYFQGKKVFYRWTNCVDGFNLPIVLANEKDTVRLLPTTEWNSQKLNKNQQSLITPENIVKMYYVEVKEGKDINEGK